MLISCPNCKTRFDIDEKLLAEERKLRCSSCRAVFRLVRKAPPGAPAAASPAPQAPVQAPPQSAAAPAQAVPQPQASQALPAQADIPSPSGRGAEVREPAQPEPQPASQPAPQVLARVQEPAAAPAVRPAGAIKVVIANESLAFCEAVRKVLSEEPFELFICTDGKEALETVERTVPSLLLLDVALPTMFGFEVCERVRQNPQLAAVKIVLIASIYDKTRYKRSPISLYGADDYLEKHHIPDSLVPMIYRLVQGSAPEPTAPSTAEIVLQEQSRSELRQAEVIQTQVTQAEVIQTQTRVQVAPPPPAGPAPELSEAHQKARRLARIIVSDIALYSQVKVEQGVRDGRFYDILADDIREGELLYRQRVPEAVRENSSYLTDAFEDLIAKKRAELCV